MTRQQDLDRLELLAQLRLDHQLARMRTAAMALDRSKTQLRAIDAAPLSADLTLVSGAMVEISYQRWADLRRSELNLVIARQTADWLAEREKAKTAFGQRRALRELASSVRA